MINCCHLQREKKDTLLRKAFLLFYFLIISFIGLYVQSFLFPVWDIATINLKKRCCSKAGKRAV